MIYKSKKKALITGVRGQDGWYLARYLLAQGYHVVGTTHGNACSLSLPVNNSNISIEVESLDLRSTSQIKEIIGKLLPDEVYNLAARSSSSQLFDDPLATAEINGLAAVRFLEAIRESSPKTRFCQAASSEMFVGGEKSPQDERTAFTPINAYGAAKAYAANMVTAYRVRHGLFATTAILYNHESPRRGLDYVTRKITHTVALIKAGRVNELRLGNLDGLRDWGYAGDYARAISLMLQQPTAEDFVIATGVMHTVGEFCDVAFSHVGLNYLDFVRVDPQWASRSEATKLCGNASKARKNLKWEPSIGFEELVQMMVDADMAQIGIN